MRHFLDIHTTEPADLRAMLDQGAAMKAARAGRPRGAPDDTLITAVLVKQFTDRQLKVDVEVISYMLTRMERSFDAARRVVGAIDDLALEERRNITVPLVRRVLENI